MKKQLLTQGAILLLALFGSASCGDTGSNGASASKGAGGAGSGSGSESGSGGGINFSGNSSTAAGSGGAQACAGQTTKAETVPLDMYLMLDKSGSMLEGTGGQGVSKWDAVTQALEAFLNDPQSVGLGVGLQYFPLPVAGLPDSCTSSVQCGSHGPCLLKACSGQGTIVACDSSLDCPFTSLCKDLGRCAGNPSVYCIPAGASCPNNNGTCVQVTSGYCVKQDSCDTADYATPAVEIAALGGAATALVSSIQAAVPQGATPTAPALQGALDHAHAHAIANPTHAVIALLATDGLPTECSPTDIGDIAQIAADGVAGSPPIRTFVIGVFSGSDVNAKSNLNQIAQAGGTQQAFLVDSNQNVTQAFLDALSAIRKKNLACEYQVPLPPPGETLNYGKVNVEHTPPGQTQPVTVLYVGDAANCNHVAGGWYYDADPQKGGSPTKILMCPATCGAFGVGGQVDIRVGCKTEIAPPK
jgi:hypothetical protein